MDETNKKTLATYNTRVPEYVAGTSHVLSDATKTWLEAALAELPLDARLLEIGSAFGRDAFFIQAKGYGLECTDAAQGFVEHLKDAGLNARPFNLLTDSFLGEYDLILANAVLLHFRRDEFAEALAKVLMALKPGGKFAFSLKRGNGDEWSEEKVQAPRYFCYWQPRTLVPLLSQSGYSDWTITSVTSERTHADWIYVIARR